MSFFNSSNRAAIRFLAALVVFSGTLASPALADDTVELDLSLTTYRGLLDSGHSMAIVGVGDLVSLDYAVPVSSTM